MKTLTVSAMALLLAGCATQTGELSRAQLERPEYVRAERTLPMNFVQIQRAIFRHQAACNTDIEYVGDENLASYARVQKPFSPGATGLSHTIVLGMTRMSIAQVRSQMYSYYAPSRDQIKEIYNAILDPETCPG